MRQHKEFGKIAKKTEEIAKEKLWGNCMEFEAPGQQHIRKLDDKSLKIVSPRESERSEAERGRSHEMLRKTMTKH